MKIKIILYLLFFCSCLLPGQVDVEKWKVCEVTLSGPSSGNPFKEVKLSGQFIKDNDTVSVPGFYDAQPRSIVLDLPEDAFYQVEVIDTWNMTITPLQKKFSGRSLIELPQKPYMAMRIIKQ